MPIIVYVDVANVNDERTVNTLEHVRVQLWLNVTHRTRLSVTFAINHVDNTVVLHCLNIKVLQTMKTGSTKPPHCHIIHPTGIKTR